MRRHCEGVAFFRPLERIWNGGVSLEPPKESENMPPRNVLLSFIAYVFVFFVKFVACIVNLSLGIGIIHVLYIEHAYLFFWAWGVLDLLLCKCFVCIDSSWGVVVLVRLR